MSDIIINNHVYLNQDTGLYWRAIYQDKQENLLAICEINEKNFGRSKLKMVSLQEYQNLVLAEVYLLQANDPFALHSNDKDLSENQIKLREARLSAILPLVNEGINLFKREWRKGLSTTAKEKNVTTKSLKKFLSLYFSRGCFPSALLPNFHHCGAPSTQRISIRKLGRPSPTKVGQPLKKPDKILLRRGFKEFYLNNSLASQFDAYTSTVNKYFLKEQQVDQDILKIEVPSLNQFIYWGRMGMSEAKIKAKRHGQIIYDKDLKILTGSANKGVTGPGSLYQIDSTQADINLVSTFDPNLSIGRPTLYLITDVYSRMIVGFTISLENASYISAALALHTAAENKVELCKSYGLSIECNDWPSCGLPYSLLADRAELKGEKGDTLVNNLAIVLKTAKSYRPDWKGNVESLFNSLQSRMKKSFYKKGTITKLDQTRIGSDSREEAVLTLEQLNKILIRFILDYNKHHYIQSYPLTEDMVLNKVKPIPCELWRYGCDKGLNRTRQIDPKKLYLNILPRKNARIDKEGVKFLGIDYTTKNAGVEKTLNNILAKGSKRVEVAYDPRNLQNIFLVIDGRFDELAPRKSQLMQRDLWDYKAMAKHLRKDATEQRKIESICRGLSDDFSDLILEESVWRQDGKVSKKNVRENRNKDLNHTRQNVGPTSDMKEENPSSTPSLERKSFIEFIKKIEE